MSSKPTCQVCSPLPKSLTISSFSLDNESFPPEAEQLITVVLEKYTEGTLKRCPYCHHYYLHTEDIGYDHAEDIITGDDREPTETLQKLSPFQAFEYFRKSPRLSEDSKIAEEYKRLALVLGMS